MWSYGEVEPNGEDLREPTHPQLTRDTCLSQKGIRSFLKLSRFASDDTLKQHLNNVLDRRDRSSLRSESKQKVCSSFVEEYLLPHWDTRLATIEFCDNEAKLLKKEIDLRVVREPKKEVDPRLDPYYERSSEDKISQPYYNYNKLVEWVENEKEIEKIVQERSIEVISDRCSLNDTLKQLFQNYK